MSDKPFKVTDLRLKRYEPKTITILQPISIPPRPKWMEGETGYIEAVYPSCPFCQSNDVWRGPWCNKPEFGYIPVRMKPPLRYSGRGRHAACLKCKGFWSEFQGIPYAVQDEVDV